MSSEPPIELFAPHHEPTSDPADLAFAAFGGGNDAPPWVHVAPNVDPIAVIRDPAPLDERRQKIAQRHVERIDNRSDNDGRGFIGSSLACHTRSDSALTDSPLTKRLQPRPTL